MIFNYHKKTRNYTWKTLRQSAELYNIISPRDLNLMFNKSRKELKPPKQKFNS